MKKRYLIIGASAAGLAAVSKIRNLDSDAEIICVAAEKEMPYNRCLLADALAGERTIKQISKPEAFFVEKKIDLRLNTRIVAIESDKQRVATQQGDYIEYDQLFLGMGKSAFVPPIPGRNAQGVIPFFDLRDIVSILSFVESNQVAHAVVIGAGLTGLECADALNALGIKVTVVEQAEQVLANQIDLKGAQFIGQLLEKNNVELQVSTSVQEIESINNNVTAVKLNTGQRVECDMVIMATGGRTNVSIAEHAGIAVKDDGVVVNERMQTSNPTIFAGGDMCLVNDLVTGGKTLSSLWPDAVMQGMVAASNMAGTHRTYDGIMPITSSTIFETTFVTCGPIKKYGQFDSLKRQEETFYHNLLLQEGILKGFVMVGNVKQVGALRKALAEKTKIQ